MEKRTVITDSLNANHEAGIDTNKRSIMPHISFWLLVGITLLFSFRPALYDIELNAPKAEQTLKNRVIQGVDLSHYQGDINWDIAAPNVDFAFIKATQGHHYIDPKFNKNASQLLNHRVPFGAYHFFEPDKSAQKQAKHFLHTIKDFKGSLRPVLDVEISQGISEDVIASAVAKWLNIVESKLGCKPIIYTYAKFYDTYLGERFNGYPFWLAEYSQTINPPKTRTNIQLWQYSQSGSIAGIHGAVDFDKSLNSGSSGTSLHELTCSRTNTTKSEQ